LPFINGSFAETRYSVELSLADYCEAGDLDEGSVYNGLDPYLYNANNVKDRFFRYYS